VANAIYPLWKQALMREIDTHKSLDQGGIDPVNGVYCSLVNIEAAYVYSDAHQFYSSVTNVIGAPSLLTTPTVAGRIFSADTVVYTNVTGIKIGAIVLYRQNSGAAATWRLVLYEDAGIIGLPMIPSGGNIIVSWNIQGVFGL
jgi:hypothetical protein